jgi:hypothetical protein
MSDSINLSKDIIGSQLLERLVKFNQTLKAKEQEMIKVRLQLQTLENNINAQVDDFLSSLSVTNLNLKARFLEVQRNNQELRSIKEYILGSSLQSDVFNHKKVLQTLEIKKIEEIYDLCRNKSLLESKISNLQMPFGKELKTRIEEDKYSSHHDRELNADGDKSQISNKKMKIIPKRKLTNFEDDDFKLNFEHKFNSPKKKKVMDDNDRIRATSSSVLEASVNPHFLNLHMGAQGKNKQLKQNEGQQFGNSGINPLLPSFGMQNQAPGLPFLPNVQIDPETICQMLIRKLAANTGLINLNDICRILPDTLRISSSILNRTRSNTE